MERMDWNKVFLDAQYLQIMYYLAKYNPAIKAETIAAKFGLNSGDVQEHLANLLKLDAVSFEKETGYTLTSKGLMSLYNFHTNFNAGTAP